MRKLHFYASTIGLLLMLLFARCLALSTFGITPIIEQLPKQMRVSMCTSTNPQACPAWLGDLGVHAIYDAIQQHQCNMHFERIKIVMRDTPKAGPGTSLVKVSFSSVNPCHWKSMLSNQGPMGLGSDISGQVLSLGKGCVGFQVGDNIWGMTDSAYAEYAVLQCSHMGLKPSNLSLEQAGVLPLVALTGFQGMELAGAPWSNKPTVLVLGGSSGTGSTGIQLAKAYGAGKIISTSSKGNFDVVRKFGADELIDYHEDNWWDVLGPNSVDIIYDCVCITGTGNHAYAILRDGGKFITIQTGSMASPLVALARPQVSQFHYVLDGKHTTKKQLDFLKMVAENGQLGTPIDKTYDLDSVAQAFERSMTGHTVGKIAIRVDASVVK